MSDIKFKKCINFSKCHHYTNNKSGLCNYCIMDKYHLWDLRTFCCDDINCMNPKIREEDVVRILDSVESILRNRNDR